MKMRVKIYYATLLIMSCKVYTSEHAAKPFFPAPYPSYPIGFAAIMEIFRKIDATHNKAMALATKKS